MWINLALFVVFIVCAFADNVNQLLYEGDACVLKNNVPGVCVRLSLCTSAQNMLEKKEQPINCGFVKNIPIVCCSEREKNYTYIADTKCAFYNTPVYSVIFGENALPSEFPHMAALGYTFNNQKVWLCGGTLISRKYVLTAAHCLYSHEYGPVKWVRLGDVNLNSTTDKDVSDAQDFEAIRTVKHPLYNTPSVYHDLALVELDRKIQINKFVKPACLFTEDKITLETELLATGWGLTKVGGNQSHILQKVKLDLFTEEECDKVYASMTNTRRLKQGILHKQQICAGGRNIGYDTCQGDSGGPLKIKKTENYQDIFYIVGITSFGKSCGFVNVPGIYTRVSSYLPWIESVIWPNEM